ncbi:MAG: hypothetical protein GQF41_1728 [Candidatus Rifleibacterium amylolyticum]|nr:MAG: hypothetical protein GQF41_1728 [Candidatus Rifleibacterium amylolyticum]
MQPQTSLSLPEAIKSDISIYLAPDEKVLKAIRSDAERTASKGQVWLILSTGSVIFHTCEIGKEPIIALLSRREIREIEYFQRLNEVVLTFVPARSPQNVTRLSFANSQRPELEDFCDDLADLISFKKETAGGVKTYAAPVVSSPTPDTQELPSSALRSAASAVKYSTKPVSESRPKVEPVAAKKAAPEIKPDVKIAESPKEAPASSPDSSSAVSIDKVVQNTTAQGAIGYVVAATVISVLVGFLWYKFFSSLARIKD